MAPRTPGMKIPMTLFFPDINVWIALSDAANSHNVKAWAWLNLVAPEDRLIFSRYTQLGLLRLLTNRSVMGEQTLTLREAWGVYDNWLEDSRVEFYPEPGGVEGSVPRSDSAICKQSRFQVAGRLLPAGLRETKPCDAGHVRQGALSSCAGTALQGGTARLSPPKPPPM